MNDYNHEVINTVRIPIQLRFERDDMFENLIAPARADRSLTTLILQLLQAYYYDENVRNIVEQMSQGFTDIEVLQKQVNRVTRAQNSASMLTNMMMSDVERMSQQVNSNTNDKENVSVMELLTQLVAKIDTIGEKVQILENGSNTKQHETVSKIHIEQPDTLDDEESLFVIDEDMPVFEEIQAKKPVKRTMSRTTNTRTATQEDAVDIDIDSNIARLARSFERLG